MRLQTELCVALGIPVRTMEPIDVYLTAGRILQDEELRQKALVHLTSNNSILPAGSRLQAIEDMTPAERRGLLERVQGVIQFRGAQR